MTFIDYGLTGFFKNYFAQPLEKSKSLASLLLQGICCKNSVGG
ncbi:MAG: hypothetical protein PUF44_03005 [Bacteroidales bacterium]|nr:hypothetical protein [Bacteroidales bacterium]